MDNRRAKIIATLGPASNTVEKITELIKAGMNVARVNMSHGTYEDHSKVIQNIRTASKNLQTEIAILMDLQGPKIRVDKLAAPLELKDDDEWYIVPSSSKNTYEKVIPTVYENLVKDADVGAKILFDDGLIQAEVIDKTSDALKIKVQVGGDLKSNKGINLPDTRISAKSFTEKDRQDLLFGLENNIDCVALSFVRTAQEINEVKYLLHKYRKNIPVVAKIEKPEAIDNIDEIIDVTDLIMVARGDMGVEIGNHLVPYMQKEIIGKCNAKGVPVVTATQMLESMIVNPTPTRAEASDVANAIWDGTDLVMLSGETASGKYPILAVKMMSRIVMQAELEPKERPLLRNMQLDSISTSLQVAASLIAEKIDATWIISMTQSGSSCRRMSQFRPRTPVLGISNKKSIVRRMSLYWGITPYFLAHETDDLHQLDLDVVEHLTSNKMVDYNDRVVITRGDGQYFTRKNSNSIKVSIIKELLEKAPDHDDFQEEVFDRGRILLDLNVCSSCHNCINICPYGIFDSKEDESQATYIVRRNVPSCAMDMECVRVCPTGAIEIIGKDGINENNS